MRPKKSGKVNYNRKNRLDFGFLLIAIVFSFTYMCGLAYIAACIWMNREREKELFESISN